MAINYTWDCKTVDVKTIDGNEDTVCTVHWRFIGEDNAKNVKDKEGNDVPARIEMYDQKNLDVSDLSDFIAFKDLTNEQVTNWVKDAIGEEKIEKMKTNISNQITELVTPSYETKTIGE